jgi:hypothetical protein
MKISATAAVLNADGSLSVAALTMTPENMADAALNGYCAAAASGAAASASSLVSEAQQLRIVISSLTVAPANG